MRHSQQNMLSNETKFAEATIGSAQTQTHTRTFHTLNEKEREREVPSGDATLRRDVTIVQDVDGGLQKHNSARGTKW